MLNLHNTQHNNFYERTSMKYWKSMTDGCITGMKISMLLLPAFQF